MLAARLSTARGIPEKNRPKSNACWGGGGGEEDKHRLGVGTVASFTTKHAGCMATKRNASCRGGLISPHERNQPGSTAQRTCMVATWRPRYANTNISDRKDRNSKNWRSVTCTQWVVVFGETGGFDGGETSGTRGAGAA